MPFLYNKKTMEKQNHFATHENADLASTLHRRPPSAAELKVNRMYFSKGTKTIHNFVPICPRLTAHSLLSTIA